MRSVGHVDRYWVNSVPIWRAEDIRWLLMRFFVSVSSSPMDVLTIPDITMTVLWYLILRCGLALVLPYKNICYLLQVHCANSWRVPWANTLGKILHDCIKALVESIDIRDTNG